MLRKFETLNNHGFLKLVWKGMSEISGANLGGDTCFIHYQQSAIIKYFGDEPVGVMVYRVMEDENYIFVFLSYVHPLHRRQGHYNEMWNELKEIAKRREIRIIQSATHPDNWAMRDAYDRQGRKTVSMSVEYNMEHYKQSKEKVARTKPVDPDEEIPF